MPKQYLLEYELDWVKHNKRNNRTYTSQQRHNRTILEKLIADPSEAPSSGATVKKCNRFDAIEQKIGFNLQEMKTIARSNISRLTDVMHQIDVAGDSRANGIGSVGGHIARLMKDPGPTNGHYKMAIEDPFNRKTTAELLPKLHLECGKELNLPEWNHRFLEGGNVLDKYDYVTDSTPERLTRISTFRQEILKYRMNSSEVSKSDPNFNRTKSRTKRGSTGGKGVPAVRSTDSLDDEFESEEESLQSAKQPVTLVMLAEELWKTLMRELKESAHSIEYSDLIEINALREPPEMVVNCIGYICILLGLEPTWQSARCALFKEFRPFQNFLREVDPIGLPVSRVKKAFHHKADKLHHVTIHALAGVCRPLAKIMRWVIAFNNIAQLIVTVEARKDAAKESKGGNTTAASTAGKSDVSTASQQTGAKKSSPAPAAKDHKAGHDDDVSVGSLSSAGLPPELKLAGDVLPIAENLARFFQDLSQEQATLQTYYTKKDLSLYHEWVRQSKRREMEEEQRLAEEEEYQDEGFDNEGEGEKEEEGQGAKQAANTTAAAAAGGKKSAKNSDKVKKAGSVGAAGGKKHLAKGSERHRSTGSSFSNRLPAATAAAVSATVSSGDDNEDWLLETVSKPSTAVAATAESKESKGEAAEEAKGRTEDSRDTALTATAAAAEPKTPSATKKANPVTGSAEAKKQSNTSGLKHPRMASAAIEALMTSVEANGGVPPSRLQPPSSSSTSNNNHKQSHQRHSHSAAGKSKKSRPAAAVAAASAKEEEEEEPHITSAPSVESIAEPTALVVEVPKDVRSPSKSNSGNNSAASSAALRAEAKEQQEAVPVEEVEVISPMAQLIKQTASSKSPPGAKRSTITVTKPTSPSSGAAGGTAAGSKSRPLQIGSSSPEVLKKAHPSTLKSRDQINPLIVLTNPPKEEPTPSARPEHIPAIAKLKPKAKASIEKARGMPIKQLTAMHPVTPKTAAAPIPTVDTSLESLLADMEELEPLDKKSTGSKSAAAAPAAGKKPAAGEVSQNKSPVNPASAATTSAPAATTAPSAPPAKSVASAAPSSVPAPVSVAPSVAVPASSSTASAATTSSPSRKQQQAQSPRKPGSSSKKKKEEEEEDPYGEDEYEEYGNDEYEQDEEEQEEEKLEVFKPREKEKEKEAEKEMPEQKQQPEAKPVESPTTATSAASAAIAAPPAASPVLVVSSVSESKSGDEDKKTPVSSGTAVESKSESSPSSSAALSSQAEAKDSPAAAPPSEGKYAYKDTPSPSYKDERKADDKNSSSSSSSKGGAAAAPTAEAKSVKALHLSLDEFVLPSAADLAGQSASCTPAVGAATTAASEGMSARVSLTAHSSDSLDATTAWNHADNIKAAASTTKPTPASSVYSAAVSTRSMENELDSMFVFDTPKAGGATSAAAVSSLLSPDGSTSTGSSSGVALGSGSSGKRGASPKKPSTNSSPPDKVVEGEEEDGGYGDDEFDVFE